ncbi:MAG: hypothetical protein FJZ63_00150 [Chlamydiae bacterium]|nr:hypothetical protein [Chlamydiota bacterium]
MTSKIELSLPIQAPAFVSKELSHPLTNFFHKRLSQEISPPISLSHLTLISLRMSKEDFLQDPLFKYAKEASNVYDTLIEKQQDTLFRQHYSTFLASIEEEDWFETCRREEIEALELGYLSLMAYLEGKIDKEDLCTLHILADAMHEKTINNITDYKVLTLAPDVIEIYLKEFHYPLFDKETVPFGGIIHSTLSTEELQQAKEAISKSFSSLSPLKRTFLLYDIDLQGLSLEYFLYRASLATGYLLPECDRKKQTIRGTLCLAPLNMAVEVARACVQHETLPLSEQICMFGYGEDADTNRLFANGRRLVSIASPLFGVPRVHDARVGPKGLGITLHDLYHLYTEIANPELKNLLKLYESLSTKISRRSRAFCAVLLDRDYHYRKEDILSTTHDYQTLNAAIIDLIAHICKKMGEQEQGSYWKRKNHSWITKEIIPVLQSFPSWDREVFLASLQSYGIAYLFPKDSL